MQKEVFIIYLTLKWKNLKYRILIAIRGCQVYKLAFNPFLLKKARASLRPMTRSF